MCQLIEVTWFIWKLSADQLIILLDRDQCLISYFLASLGSEHRKTDTHIGHQCCDQLTAVKTRYSLISITWPRAQVTTHRGQVFFEVIRWQDTGFQMIAGSSLIFFNSFEICCVYVPHNENFYFKLTSDAKIQPAATGRETVAFDFSHHVHAFRVVTLYVRFLC